MPYEIIPLQGVDRYCLRNYLAARLRHYLSPSHVKQEDGEVKSLVNVR